jgi:hypothetical protein
VFADTSALRIKDLKDDTLEDIRTVMGLGGDIHWNNQGHVRKLPNGILVDVFEAFDFWGHEPERLKTDIPQNVGVFFWEDTVAIHRRPPSL